MKTLQAGPISAGYENGFLRRINYGGVEIIRMIYFALRDHNWNTLNHHVENEDIAIDDDGFRIMYDCFHIDGGVSVMSWRVNITGKSEGTIVFEIKGTAKEAFRKNRAGFCILHPLNVLDRDCRLSHADGSSTTGVFPRYIAPDNPFKNIRSMAWETNDLPFSLEFEGDIFETEDQRNWGDASFKTFCTPLDKPFPVELKKGEEVWQRVTFKPGRALPIEAASSAHVVLRDTGRRAVLPALGIGASTEVKQLPDKAISNLRALRLSHCRVDLYPASETFAADFSAAYENAFALGLPLEAVLHLTENYAEEMEAFSILCRQNKVRLKKVLLLQSGRLVTGQAAIDAITSVKDAFPKVLFGGGTNYNFNEINKNHFRASNLDFISFSMDPQEHAFDDLTILENTGSLEHLIQSAKNIYGDNMAVHISPLALRKRFNPYATNPADLYLDELKKADPRQKQAFASVFTFASLCSISEGGASAVTLYQTSGDQGIVSKDGEPYPVYETLKSLSAFQGKAVATLESSDALTVVGMVLDGTVLGMCNLSDRAQTVRMDDREYSLNPREVKFERLNRA